MSSMLNMANEILMAAHIALRRATYNMDVLKKHTYQPGAVSPFTEAVAEADRTVTAIRMNVGRALKWLSSGMPELAVKELGDAVVKIMGVRTLFIEEIIPYIGDLQIPDPMKTELFLEAEDILRSLERAYEMIRRSLWMITTSIQQR